MYFAIVFMTLFIAIFSVLYFIECRKYSIAKKKRESLLKEEMNSYRSLMTMIDDYLKYQTFGKK